MTVNHFATCYNNVTCQAQPGGKARCGFPLSAAAAIREQGAEARRQGPDDCRKK
jgi:hypothetical protein